MSDEFTLTDEQIQQALGPVSGRSARPELSLVQPDPEPEPTPAPEPLDLSWRPDDPNERRDIPPAFDWDAAAQQMKADDERAIRGRLNLAKKDNPDTQAKVQRLSSATGLPPDLVARDPEDVQRRHEVASIDLDQLRRDAPITYSRLTDPQFLGVAHDDIQTMGSLERWIKGSALSAVGGATVGVGSAALDASAFVARGLSAVTPEIAGVDFFGRAAADLSARAGAADEALKWLIPDAESSTESAFQSGFQSFGQNMALMPLGVAQTSAQAAGAAIAYAFGAVTGSKAYGEATRAGKGDMTAGIHGVTQAAIEAGTELIPAIKFFEMLGSRTGVVEMLAKQVGWEGATEQIATLLQDMGEWLVMNQDGTLKEFLEARPEAAYQTLIATLVGTVAQVGTMKGIMAVTDKASGKAQSQQKAQDGANALQRAFDIVAKSKTQERSPETIAEFVADVAPDQSLYVDAQVLNQSARKMPPEEFTRLFPKTAEQMAEALVTHSDVEMPLSEVLAAAGTDLESVLVENARLDDNPETLSSADAKAEVRIAEEMIKADAERVMQQAADQDAWAQSADEVYQAVLADLNTANRFTPEVNEVYAILTRDLFSSLASRVGMTPREFFQKYRLRSAGQSQGGQELSQDGTDPNDFPAVATGDTVGGLSVRGHVPNMDSISASLEDYEVLPGVRSIPRSAFDSQYVGSITAAKLDKRTAKLMDDIRASGEINPLIVAVDGEGLYIIEGGHRFDALLAMGVTDIPAVVVLDQTADTLNQSTPPDMRAIDRAELNRREGREPVTLKPGKISQTDTPAFREWFGNSKVVDESGKPLVVYHGTGADVTQFNTEGRGKTAGAGAFFSTSPELAATYATGDAPNIVPTYLNIRTPAVIDAGGANWARLGRKVKVTTPAIEVSDQFGEDLLAELEGREPQKGTTKKLKAKNTTLGKLFADELVYDDDYASTDDLARWAKNQGYDGVIIKNVMDHGPSGRFATDNKVGDIYVAFRPEQIKSATGNSGQFSREDPNILHQSVWSSTLKTRISEQSNKTRTGKEWGQWLAANLSKLGIKKAEVEANGILDYLELKGKEKVTGADIAAWLDANGVQVTETVLGSTNSELNAMNAELAGSGYSAEYDAYSAEVAYIDPDGESIEFDDMPEDVQEIIQRRIDGTVERAETEQTKFDQYQLPGGENYRELLLTLPDASTSIESGERYRVRFFDETGRDRIEHATMPQVEAFRRRGNRAEVLGPVITNDDSRNFRSSHFDQPNILAHIRFNERTDSEGNRVLFIEEIQSDWAQEGRKEGFNARSVSEIDAELSAVNKERSRLLQEAADLPDSEMAKFREMNARIKELAQRAQELDAQAQEAVGKNKVPSAPFVTDTKAWVALSLKRMIRYAADNGFDRIAWTTGEQQYNRYPEADAESDVGKKRNEGMRAFYDNIVPQVANELLKKMGGGKVETVDVGIGGVRWSVNWVEDGSEIDSTVSYTSEREATDAAKEWTDQTGDAAEVRAIPRPSPQSGFTLTDSLRDVAAGGMPLFQGGAESLATFNPEKLLITLKEKSNLSSYPHELGHFYLEVLADVASQPDAPQQIVDDMNTVLAWFGVPDLATWNGYTLAEKEVYHEKYAESFEQYLFEGKAPSVELQLIFRRFRAWMMSVYKNLTQFLKQNKNADLNDEIRQVMNRMVATDEAIAAAEKAAGMDSDFEATNTAIEALQKRSLANMKWLTNAKSRFIKALQKQAESLRKGVREEISAKLQKEPVYRAIAYIRKGSITGPGGTQIKLEKGTTRKLSRAAVEQMFDADSPLPWRAALEGMLAESGADPDFIAQEVGFSSGAEMVDALIHVEPLKDAIERETDRVMLERHGELTTPELVEQAANEAVHNKARARALAAELTSQQEALSARETAGTTPRGKTVTVNAVMAAAKRFAADLVARKKIRDLKRAAQLHRSAEAKASKAWAKATAAGKTAEAIQAKRDQALNNAAARAMLEAIAETEKALEYLKKFDRATIRKNIPIDYLEQIDNLLERVDLRKSVSGKALDRRESLRQWYTAQEEMGLTPVIPQYLLDDAQLTSYKDMTVEELRGLVDSVKNIEHLGKLKHKLLTLKDKREFDALVDEMVASIEANGGKAKVIPPEGRGPADKWMNGFLATHRKFASVLRQMDGLNDDGIFWQTLVRAMNDRATDEQVRLAAATEHLGKLIQPLIDMPGGLEGGKRLVRALKAPMSRAGRIAVMLNTGNTQNRQRMEDGNGITAAAIEEIAAQMTPAELEFVNQAWEFVDSFWPEVKAKQERVTGLSEDKVEAEPFEAIANDGTRVQMRGGYYPIKYDPDQSVVAHKQEATQTALEMFRGAITRATTRRGHTEARVKEVKGRPVRLNLEVLSSHTAEVIHDLVWHEWLIDANRVLSDPRVSEAIRKHQGPDTLRTLKDDLVGVAGGDIVAMDSIHKALMRLRANISRAVMGISMTTGLLQPFGILQSVVRVGWGPVLRGLGRWAGDAAQLESSMTWIREKSPFMKLRAQTFNRELYEINKRIKGKAKITEIVDAGLFMMMQKMQMVADIPTWIGTYQKVLEETQDEALAIAQADRAVKESQGSGQTVDLSAVQRDHPFLTQFYSYFNTTLNLAAEITSQTDFKNPKAVAGWVSDMALLMVAPAIIPSLLISLFRGEGDDDDAADWALKLAGWQVSYLAGLFVGVREFSGILQGFDYSGPPVGRILNDIGRMGKQIGQGEVDEAAVIAAANVLGSGLGLPTVQLLRFYKGWKAWEEGEAPPTAVLFGPPHK